MNIKRKVERAFKDYLSQVAELSGLEMTTGHDAEVKGFPLLICHCQRATECDGLVNSQEYDAELVVQLITQVDDEALLPQSDERLADIVRAMRDTDAIKAALNYPGDGEPDGRAATVFHLVTIEPVDEDDRVEGRHFVDTLQYHVVCADFDQDP